MRRLLASAIDPVLAVLFGALAWAELLVWHEWSSESRVVQGVGVTIVCGSLAIRRRFPLATVAIAAAGTLVVVVGGNPPQIYAAGLAAMLISYSLAAALEGWPLRLAVAIFAASWLVRDIVDPSLNGFDIALDGLPYAATFTVGRVVRRRERTVDLVARVAEDRTLDAVRSERARIARELHDVIAHGMTVMVVQADAARHGLDPDDVETRAALVAIERVGRESLGEMRRLLGLLREPDADEAADIAPQAGIAGIADFVESITKAGLPVDLRVSGIERPLPPGLDLAAYRIVQESLTNALRHAGPARATVEIGYRARELALRIEDSGRGRGRPAGNGLLGMRERALLYGGSFAAGRGSAGFVVSASLPLEEP